MVDTTARGGSHGQAVVSPTAVVDRFPPVVRVFSRGVSFSSGFALFCLYISDVFGLLKGTQFTHSNHLLDFS